MIRVTVIALVLKFLVDIGTPEIEILGHIYLFEDIH